MIEFVKHLVGGCGEPHPNLLWFLPVVGTTWYLLKHNIKWCWKRGCELCMKPFKVKQDG